MGSSSLESKWSYEYDVFLSFRGSDVRKGFIGHLYAALCRNKIRAFFDEDKIQFGDNIGPACINGIHQSRFALLILSKDYAFSPWCLEELHYILQSKHPDDIWPIFYDVDPSHVHNITGSYAKAFLHHEIENRINQNDLIMWKQDLCKVSRFQGLNLQMHLDGDDTDFVDHIVEEISKRLDSTPPIDLKSPANEVISLIAGEIDDVRIIGVYGMVGIGKTTIAKEVYNKIAHKFEASCFIDNVRELSVSKGVAYLQRQLLTVTLRRKHEKINNIDQGLNVIVERLCHKKVLLVLDDIDKIFQLNEILGRCDWLFPGSRVIITTRIKDFLQPSEFYWQYEVKELDYDNSLQLLKLHAFEKNHILEDYNDSAQKLVHHAGGNPLALEVLGSSLHGQNADAWNTRLEKLKVIGEKDIYGKLKICYDALDDTEKFIFLDIACFFIGYKKDYVMSILEGCRFFPIDGINTLIRRCLVKVSPDNRLVMHKLIRDMGREVVRQQHPTDPGERSRLWQHENVIDVLTDKSGTKAVEGLAVNMSGLRHSWKAKAFKKMKLLRLLQLNHVRLTGSFEYISCKLRWLCWHGFPLESIPSDLCLENLIALDLRHSSVVKFSEEGKSLPKLKLLNLSHSHKLMETPDFKDCLSLEKLVIKNCTGLEKLHNSIGCLSHLVSLNMQDCKKLQNLPESIGGLLSLEKLNLSGCSKLEELRTSIGHLIYLVSLNLQDCENLKILPENIGDMKALRELNVSGCTKFEELPESIGFLALLFLNLQGCKNLINLPSSIGDLKSLVKLNMSGCSRLEEVPESMRHLSCLCSWNLQDCKNLKSLPSSIYSLNSLKELNISGCSKLAEELHSVNGNTIHVLP